MGDFDFLVGAWDVANRRLRERHVGSDDWDEFAGVSEARSFFDGAGSFDEMRCPSRGFSGSTVRLLDPATGLWSIYWMNSRRGVLELPPVVGRFTDGVGTFHADDSDEDGRCAAGSSGRRSPPPPAAGSRRSPPTANAPGKPTGSWSSPGEASARTAAQGGPTGGAVVR